MGLFKTASMSASEPRLSLDLIAPFLPGELCWEVLSYLETPTSALIKQLEFREIARVRGHVKTVQCPIDRTLPANWLPAIYFPLRWEEWESLGKYGHVSFWSDVLGYEDSERLRRMFIATLPMEILPHKYETLDGLCYLEDWVFEEWWDKWLLKQYQALW